MPKGGITVRHGSSLAHLRSVDEAASLMLKLASGPQAETLMGAQHLSEFQAVLQEAPAQLGLQRRAQTEDIRVGLVLRGEEELAKEYAQWRAGRRSLAHPPANIRQRVQKALEKPLVVNKPADTKVGLSSEASNEAAPSSTVWECFIGDSENDQGAASSNRSSKVQGERNLSQACLADIKDILLTLRADVLCQPMALQGSVQKLQMDLESLKHKLMNAVDTAGAKATESAVCDNLKQNKNDIVTVGVQVDPAAFTFPNVRAAEEPLTGEVMGDALKVLGQGVYEVDAASLEVAGGTMKEDQEEEPPGKPADVVTAELAGDVVLKVPGDVGARTEDVVTLASTTPRSDAYSGSYSSHAVACGMSPQDAHVFAVRSSPESRALRDRARRITGC